MARLTGEVTTVECRVRNCDIEEWIEDLTGVRAENFRQHICAECPLMRYVNKLAKYEDAEGE